MNQPFEIKFDFPLAHSDLTISLKATAELHHSDPYYVISDFHFAKTRKGSDISLLPAQEVKLITRGLSKIWVHRESERESMLSTALGKAIENIVGDAVE